MRLMEYRQRTLRLAIDGEFGAFVVASKNPILGELIKRLAHRELSMARNWGYDQTPEGKKKQREANALNADRRHAQEKHRRENDPEFCTQTLERRRKLRAKFPERFKEEEKLRRQTRTEAELVEDREYFRVWMRNKRRTDIQYCLGNRLRSRIWHALDYGVTKAAKTAELTGCSIAELRAHLESKFAEGMSWENRDKWHIDHIIPCASFDLSDPVQQKKCFHWSNLQPLWQWDNQSKSAKLEWCAAA